MERRSSPRVPFKAPAEIEIFESDHGGSQLSGKSGFPGVVETIDISLGGFSARILRPSEDSGKVFSPAIAYTLVGKEISVSFRDFGITVWGKVVRVEPTSMIMAVIMTRVSDIHGWREICSNVLYAQAVR